MRRPQFFNKAERLARVRSPNAIKIFTFENLGMIGEPSVTDPCSALSRYHGTTAMWGNGVCSPKSTEQGRPERRDSHITQATMVARVTMIEKGCNGIFRKSVYNMSIEEHKVDHEDGNWLEDERNPPFIPSEL